MLSFLISLIIVSQLLAPASAVVDNMTLRDGLGYPVRKLTGSFEPVISASSAIVMDVSTGKILYQKEAYTKRPIASLSKLMTAIVFLESGHDWQEFVEVTRDDKASGGKVEIMQGEQIKLEDLFNAALISSLNSAAYELAQGSGITYEEFISRMNSKGREIGMENFQFVEPTGLDARNSATAKDVAVLLRYAMGKSEIKEALSSTRYSFRSAGGKYHYLKNTNELLESYLKPLGGKTGYIDEAGFCLADYVVTDDCPTGIVTVILGSPSQDDRFQANKVVTQWALDNWFFN